MKKIIILLGIITVMCSVAYSQDKNTYYYYQGEKEFVTVDKQRISALMKKNHSVQSAVNMRSLTVQDTIRTSGNDYDFFILTANDKQSQLSYSNTISALTKNSSVIRIEPCFISIDGIEIAGSPYIYIKLKSLEDISVLQRYCDLYKLKIVDQSKFFDHWFTLQCTSETPLSSIEVANILFESNNFASAAPDFITNDLQCAQDPDFSSQWGLMNGSYPNIDISACNAWEFSTGKGIVVAVLDEGIEKTHRDLSANIYNLSYDTESRTSPSRLFGSHGTHCAGIIAAVKDNNLQVAGAAPDAKLMDISNSLDGVENSRIKRAEGIKWAWQNGAHIISNSWGSSVRYDVINEAIAEALTRGRNGKGTVIAFSSGNNYSSSIGYPADCNPDILAVGSITISGGRSGFSNYGTGLDIVAPGSNILSTVPGNSVDYMSGTSMACPYVAGVAALVLSVNPNLTGQEVRDIIEKTAKKVGGYTYSNTSGRTNGIWNDQMGYGLIDAYEAIMLAQNYACVANLNITTPITQSGSYRVSNTITASSSISSNIEVNFSGNTIILRPGFRVSAGTSGKFFAKVDPCSVSYSSAESYDGNDLYDIKGLKNTTKIEENKFMSDEDISIYPNPTNGIVYFSCSDFDAVCSVKIYSSSGALVYTNTKLRNGDVIDISTQAKGLYLVRIEAGGKTITEKIILK